MGFYFEDLQDFQRNSLDALSSIFPTDALFHGKPLSKPLSKVVAIEAVVAEGKDGKDDKEEEDKGKKVDPKKFWLIAGVFQSEKRAQKLLARLKKETYLDAQIRKEKQRSFVAYGTYATKEEARAELNRISPMISDDHPWIKVIQ